jgi:hypothetical protein
MRLGVWNKYYDDTKEDIKMFGIGIPELINRHPYAAYNCSNSYYLSCSHNLS